jgi:hypothetical protein
MSRVQGFVTRRIALARSLPDRLKIALDQQWRIERRLTAPDVAYAELARRWHADDDPMSGRARSLAPYELAVFSQSGEDGVLCEILRRIGREPRHESFVEFGTQDGSETICGFLAYALGWSGLFMEGDPIAGKVLEQRWAGSDVRTATAYVTPESLNAALDAHDVPAEPAVFVIDVDGDDYHLWKALERRPLVVVIEYNGTLPLARDHIRVPAYRRDIGPGSSLGTLEGLAATLGYRLVHTSFSGVNAFFVRDDVAAPFGDLRVSRRAANHFNTGSGAFAPAWE